MISSFSINGYRRFEHFELNGLGRVNLLVGPNSSGKTSVLEALYLLASGGDPEALLQILGRRGERMPSVADSQSSQWELDVRHLFRGHTADHHSNFRLRADHEDSVQTLGFSIHTPFQSPTPDRPETPTLEIETTSPDSLGSLLLTTSFGIRSDVIETAVRRSKLQQTGIRPCRFVTPESLDAADLVSLWDTITLTDDESFVLNSLRLLDDSIDRIASQRTPPRNSGMPNRGGFIVKQRFGGFQPVPIGSLGEGMWRMLALAISIAQCRGGVLLVDEIDTGLHYSVMPSMWRMIAGAAKNMDVQVFATTHSSDCVRSLASECVHDVDTENRITLHRIEPGKSKSVPYSEAEIRTAAERNIEVR